MKTFILISLIFLSSIAFGQLKWDTATSLPQNGRHGAISFEISGKIYYGLGRNASGTILSDFWEYNSANDSWTQKANYPAGARFLAGGFSVGDKGYVCMGYTSTQTTDSFLYEYNPANNTWTQKASFPGNSRYAMGTFVIGDTAYIGTGACENGTTCFYQDFWKYSPSTNTWTQLANFPGGGSVNVCGFAIGNFGYFGNRTTTSYSPSNNYWKYNPSNDSWASIASMPGSARKLTEAFILDGEAFVGCGTHSGSPISNYLSDFYKYNPALNSWTHFTSDSLFEAKYDPEVLTVDDSIVYSIGGKTSASSLKSVWKLNINSSFNSDAIGSLEWKPKAAIPQFGRYNAISFSIDGKLYVGLGEIPGPEYSKELWEFDPTTNLWTKKTDYPGNGSRLATAFVVDGKAYVGLGESASGRHIDFYEYNPASDSWIQKANFPGGVRYAAGSFVLGDSAFVGLGSCGGPTCYNEDLWMYVPSTNSWTQKANWPGGKVSFPVAFSIGQYGYFGNGLSNSSTLSNSFYKYDKSNDSWSTIPSLPGTSRRNTTSFIFNNEAYVGCGAYNYSNPTFENDFYKYNSANNTWSHFTSNNAFVGRFLGICESVSDSVIIAGAGNSGNGYLADFWQLKLDFDTCDYFDTTFVTINDTTFLQDTIFVNDTTFFYDTTFITNYDTITVTVLDTTQVFDTTYLSVQDTLSFNINSSSVSSPQYVGVKVYPNPAGSNITIDIANFSLLSNYSLKIYNTLGSVVHSQNVTAATHQISTSGFGGAGTYFLEFYDSNNAKKSRKVLILN